VGLFVSVSPVQADNPPRTEIVGERTENSKTYDNHDGTRGLDSYIGVIHYKDDYASATELWKDIDTTIVNGRVDKAPYTLCIGYASGLVTIKDKKTGAITTIGLKDIEGEIVKLDNPVEQGNLICFQDVAEDTDIVIEATNTHVRFKRVLKSDNAPLTATFAIYQQGEGITVTPLARDNYYADVKVDSKLEDGLLTETIAKYNVGELCYPVEVDPSIDVRVSASTDDSGPVLYNTGAGAWQTYGTAYVQGIIGFNTVNDYKYGAGMRFLNVTVPQGSTISTAYINLTPYYSNGNVNATICTQLGNSATFSTLADYQARRGTDVGGTNDTYHTANFTYWNNVAAWTANVTVSTPSIVSTIQEAVNNNTWQSGYAMTVFIDDHKDRTAHVAGAVRQWDTYDYLSTYAPLLHVDYTVNNATLNTLRCTGFGKDWLLLNGNVTAYGGPINITYAGFSYGTTLAYGATAVNTYANYTIVPYGYYKYISGLNSQTLYNYNAVAYNGSWGSGGNRWFSTAGASITNSMEWESNIAAVNITKNVYGSYWAMQTFTTNSTAHTLTGVDLWLSRNASPGDITVTLQQTSGGLPYGTVLSTGVIPAQYTGNINPISSNTSARYPIAMSPEVSLSPNTQYCWTVKALMGDNVTNYLQVATANTTYGYGQGYTSTNNGLTWTDASADFLFDLWGHGCLQVDQAQVYNSYKNPGDWLMVFFYRNVYPPYYPVQDSKQYFVYQLVDDTNAVLAQSSCQVWGARPGSLYLSSAMITGLTWSGAYRIRLTNLRDGTVYMEYPLQSSDWKGTDLELLDSWVISMAQQLQAYDNTTYLAAVSGRGTVLNSAGGVIFATGIPLLDTIRPNLFQIVSVTTPPATNIYPQTMRTKFTPVLMLGTDAWATMTSIGNVVGVDGRTVGAAGLFLVLLVVAGWGFQPGHTVAATVLTAPVVVLGLLTGLIDWLVGALILAIALIVFCWKVIFSGG
jgi:hypothetical protein